MNWFRFYTRCYDAGGLICKTDDMNKIKIFAPISIDGFISRIDGDIDWMMKYITTEDYGYNDFLSSIGGVVFNQRHYTKLQNFDFSWQYTDRHCFIVTSDPYSFSNKQDFHFLVRKNGAKLNKRQHINKLREVKGDIWLAGDSVLISQFLEMELIDEVILLVIPVILGNGLPLIARSSWEGDWMMAHHQAYDNGVIRLDYHRIIKDHI